MRRFGYAFIVAACGSVSLLLFQNMSGLTPTQPFATQCFSQEDSFMTPFEVLSNSAQPAFVNGDYKASYPGYPARHFGSATLTYNAEGMDQNQAMGGQSRFQANDYYWLWGNRCAKLRTVTGKAITTKDNPVNAAMGCEGNVNQTTAGNDSAFTVQNDATYPRVIYSSYHRADVCTRMQLARLTGGVPKDFSKLDESAENAGLILYDFARPNTLAGAPTANLIPRQLASETVVDGRKFNFFVDYCPLSPVGMDQASKGVIVDWEVFDNRPPALVVSHFTQMAAIAHRSGKKLIVMTNDFANAQGTHDNGQSFAHNGISRGNISQVIDALDGLAPVVWSGATAGSASGVGAHARVRDFASDWCEQRDFMQLRTDQKPKIWLDVSLYDLQMNATPSKHSACGALPNPLNEAKWLHDEAVNENYAGVFMWRNNVKQGGACGDTFTSPTTGLTQKTNQLIACLIFSECSGKFRTQ